jgi:ABC-type proline/glycine betaine transport system permease subunit
MITLISLILGGIRSAIVSATLLIAVVATGLWYDTMITFTQTIVATLLTMIVGVVVLAFGLEEVFELSEPCDQSWMRVKPCPLSYT